MTLPSARRLQREAVNLWTDRRRRLQVRVGLEAARANARLQRKLGDVGLHTFLLNPASRSGITRRLQSAGTYKPTSFRQGFCLRLPGDRAWLVTYSGVELRARGAVAEYVQKRPKLRYYCSRWPVASALNRLRWTCWSDLVDWALAGSKPKAERQRLLLDDGMDRYSVLRGSPRSARRCGLEASEKGTCYCGKFRAESVEAAAREGKTALVPGGVVVPDGSCLERNTADWLSGRSS